MRQDVFFKSTLRQPVRTLFLLLLIGVLSFAFTLRAGEYQLIRQESERIGSYYRAIGELKWEGDSPDFQAAVDYLEDCPYVKTVNLGTETSGVIQNGFSNVNFTYSLPSSQIFDALVSNFNVFFYGKFLYSGRQGNKYGFVFRVDEVLGAYPEYLEPGKEVILYGTALGHVSSGLEKGNRYLLRGYYDYSLDYSYQNRYSLLDGPKPEKQPWGIYEMMPLWEGGSLYINAPENLNLQSEPEITQALYLTEENQRAVYVRAYTDVSASRWMQESDRTFYLSDGRWPDREDNDSERRVCAIHRDLAELRGLQVGDTLTLKLRNVENMLYGGGCPETDLEAYAALETQTEEFEIVGIFGEITEQPVHSNEIYIPLSVYPNSFPADFHLTTYTYTRYSYASDGSTITSDSTTERSAGTFVLNSPEEEDAFLTETEAELAVLGFRADFLENGWDSFQAAVTPMKASALSGTLLFAGILTVALFLAGFLYFRFRRKELAISRALGVPVEVCVRKLLLPLALIGSIGILAGCVAARIYIGSHAGQILQTFEEFGSKGEASGLSLGYLALLFAGQFALLIAIGALYAVPMARCPVLSMLQGGSQKRTRTAAPETVSEIIPQKNTPVSAELRPEPTAISVSSPAGKPGLISLLRFTGRCIFRSLGKNLLISALAAVFLVGLMFVKVAIVQNENKLDTLYDTVTVDLDIVKAYSTGSSKDRGFLYQRTVDNILSSGYISGCYLESEIEAEDVRQVDALTGYILERPDESTGLTETLHIRVQSFSDPERFFSDGLNSTYQITWLDGWDERIFTQEQTDVLPAVVPKVLYDSMNAQESGRIAILLSTQEGLAIGKFTVAGISEGGTGNILAPLWVMQELMGDSMTYYKATFTIDSAKNRELQTFREDLDEIIAAPEAGTSQLSAVLWDQELTQAVGPLEQVITFMRTLYPIVVILSALASAGVTILVTMTLSRDAAIFRVLGSSRRRTQAMLWLQTVPACLVGLIAGHTGSRLLAYGVLGAEAANLMLPALCCALLYFAASALAALCYSAAMTANNPLQLLQVKE